MNCDPKLYRVPCGQRAQHSRGQALEKDKSKRNGNEWSVSGLDVDSLTSRRMLCTQTSINNFSMSELMVQITILVERTHHITHMY